MKIDGSVLISISLGTVLACAACSNDSHTAHPRPDNRTHHGTSTGFALQGLDQTTWTSTCMVNEEKTKSAQTVYIMSDLALEKDARFFDGGSCEPDALYAVRHISYDHVKIYDSDELPGSKLLRVIVKAMSLEATTDTYAQTLNDEKAYDYTDWQNGTKKDIIGKNRDARQCRYHCVN